LSACESGLYQVKSWNSEWLRSWHVCLLFWCVNKWTSFQTSGALEL